MKKTIISLVLALVLMFTMSIQAFAADITGAKAVRHDHGSSYGTKTATVYGIVSGQSMPVGVLTYKCNGTTETVTATVSYHVESTKSVLVTLATGVDTNRPKYYSNTTYKIASATKTASHKGASATYGTTITIEG